MTEDERIGPGGGVGLAEALAACPVVAILRATTAERFGAVADVLVEEGIRAVEFTFTTPDVERALADFAERRPEHAVLGAGTVTTVAQARIAVEAGASFLVSPDMCPEVIEEAHRLQVPIVAGALTPTEILGAWRAGATMVKVFPASTLGVSYLKAVRGPLPDIPLVPTGGVDIANAAAYLEAGATALGIGGPLVGRACEPDGDLAALAQRARDLVAAVRAVRA